MNLSHAYGSPPSAKHAERLLHRALELGYTLLDTAALYGFGENEKLLGRALKNRRQQYILSSKCGMFRNDAGVRAIDGRPETLRKTCEQSLQRLGTDVIDLYYLHRVDSAVPVEESVGALADLVGEGKIRAIGLSEVSADTLRKAHAIYPITALQTEYSLWTRNPEIAALDACRELGIAFVAFSPLARGFLTGKLTDVSTLEIKDIRRNMPRFEAENYARNLRLLDEVTAVAAAENCTPAQLALAWLLGRDDNIIPIPGTTSLEHLQENFTAATVRLSAKSHDRLDRVINQSTVSGARYNAATQMEIDTEEFPMAANSQ